MRRRSSVEPSKILPSQVLHPTLQAALESLDVQLDEELSRYRRLRVHQPKPSKRRQRLRQPDVVAVTALGGRTQPQTGHQASPADTAAPDEQPLTQTQPVIPPVAIAPHLSMEEPGELASSSGSDLAVNAKEVAQTLANQDDLGPDDYLESSEELLKSIAEEESLRTKREPGLLESLLTPLGIGSMLLLLLSSATFGYIIMNPSSLNLLGAQRSPGNTNVSNAAPGAANNPPVASAGSSEALAGPDLASQEFKDLNLDTLSSIPPASPVQPAVPPSPIAANANSGGTAAANPGATNPGVNTAIATAPAAGIPQVAVPQQVPAPQPTSANGSSRQATNTPTRRTARRVVSPDRATPVVRHTRTANRAATPTQRSQPVAASQPAHSAPAASPAASVTASRPASPPPANSDRYYVVTHYNSDRSLTQARQAVGDAYVRNFPSGAQVQLGVFSERQRAQQLMQDLQQQGISAEIYQP